jgi:uncharacterized membrane protein
MNASRKPEYILAYIASVVNIVLGAVLLMSLIAVSSYGLNAAVALIYALVFTAIILNYTGARTCRTNRPRGGVIMISTAVPLLGYIIFVLAAPTSVYIADYWWMSALMLLWLFAQVLSIAAAVLCLIPTAARRSGQSVPPRRAPDAPPDRRRF